MADAAAASELSVPGGPAGGGSVFGSAATPPIGEPAAECPCGGVPQGSSLAECCGPLLEGEEVAASAEALMRSRYTAYVLGDEAQQMFADWGYRPVNETVLEANKDKFPDPPGLFTIEDLGGWEKVNAELFDIEGGAIAEIEEEAGVSTAG